MPSIRSAAALAVALLTVVLGAAAPAGASITPPRPLTTGPNYDRNPVLVEDGRDALLFFARSQQACNRLDGCDADNSNYDLYVKRSVRGGAFGPATLVAVNPGPPGLFRGRTIAAARTADGTIHVFWASGGNSSVLYHLQRPAGSSSFSAPEPVVVPDLVMNVEAIAAPDGLRVYTEEPTGINASRYVAGALVDRSLVAAGQNIPKAIRDRRGTYRMTMTDGNNVSVASSPDGLHFGPPAVVTTAGAGTTVWDPTLAQTEDGIFVLAYAPDLGDGRQRIEVRVSWNFATWSGPFPVTSGTDWTTKWWDYWPELDPSGDGAAMYYTSERPAPGTSAGTGHIWLTAAR